MEDHSYPHRVMVHGRPLFPRARAAKVVLGYSILFNLLYMSFIAYIIDCQRRLANLQTTMITSGQVNQDIATNNYRLSFNALALIATLLGVVTAWTGVFYENCVLLAMYSIIHVYYIIHAACDYVLWDFSRNLYELEKTYNSPYWVQILLVVTSVLGFLVWPVCVLRMARAWSWKSAPSRAKEALKVRPSVCTMYNVHFSLLQLAPFILLGYLNRNLVQMESFNGSTGLLVSIKRLLVGLLGVLVLIVLPGSLGLRRESRLMTGWFLFAVTGFLVASTSYYISFLTKEMAPASVNPWHDPALHAVTLFFLPVGIIYMVSVIITGSKTFRNYGLGYKTNSPHNSSCANNCKMYNMEGGIPCPPNRPAPEFQ